MDALLQKAEKELYFWHMTDNDNFTSRLFSLIAKADSHNKNLLKKVYPYEVQVMDDFQNKDGYWDEIEKNIKGNI